MAQIHARERVEQPKLPVVFRVEPDFYGGVRHLFPIESVHLIVRVGSERRFLELVIAQQRAGTLDNHRSAREGP
jgi:hypothetical protein